jgi:hypothetical protein
MKFIVGLSSCALVALCVTPSLAANRAISSSTVRSLSLPSTTETIYVAGLVLAQSEIQPGQQVEYTVPFANTTYKLSGNAVIKVVFEPQNRISGYINFTNYPGVSTLCGAGNFTGMRQGRTLQFNFVSSDPDPGCGFDRGLNFTVSATLSQDNNTIEGGSYQINNMQAGVFQPASIQAAEVEKQRKQWARLTPKQKKEYLARQRASQEAQAAFWIWVLTGGTGGGSSEPSTSGQDRERSNRNQQDRERAERQAERDRQPAPAPVTPIGGNCGLYGKGPCY